MLTVLHARQIPLPSASDVMMAPQPEATPRPEGMQVDSSITSSGAAGPSVASSSQAPTAEYDAAMAEPVPRRQRPHSEAPMRKLSVNLIDTYKLINQVTNCQARLNELGLRTQGGQYGLGSACGRAGGRLAV